MACNFNVLVHCHRSYLPGFQQQHAAVFSRTTLINPPNGSQSQQLAGEHSAAFIYLYVAFKTFILLYFISIQGVVFQNYCILPLGRHSGKCLNPKHGGFNHQWETTNICAVFSSLPNDTFHCLQCDVYCSKDYSHVGAQLCKKQALEARTKINFWLVELLNHKYKVYANLPSTAQFA